MTHGFNTAILRDVAHRPWPMPAAAWVMTQTWHDVLFAHWRVDAAQLRARVPDAFQVDLFDGAAWVGIVPFHMTNVGPRGVPRLPRISAFPELNVRTYVRVGDRPGVYFFSLDAGSWMAVQTARALLNLPYFTASMDVKINDRGIEYDSRRKEVARAARFIARYGPDGRASCATAGSLEHFLTERYCLYNVDRGGSPYRLEIHHPPWRLQKAHAEIAGNTMAEVNGITLGGELPLLHYAKRQDAVAWRPSRLDRTG